MLKHFRSGSKRIRSLWWILTIGTVVTFIGGFIFIFGSGVGDVGRAMSDPAVIGKVGNRTISQAEFANSMATATAQFQAQYGSTPQGRDLAILREQVWNNLVTERALDVEAKRLGIGVTDGEVIYAVKNTPPPDVTANPVFQTSGRFDPAKWNQALSDPSVNWSPIEDRMRTILPAQRLEERVIAGLKISEPELKQLFANQYDKVKATVVSLPLDGAPIDSARLDEKSVKAYYDAHPGEFTGAKQVRAILVAIPRSVGPEEERAAKSEADAIVTEARGGRDFAQLAKERSQGPFAEQGGEIARDVPVASLPPAMQAAMANLPIGGVTDPIREGNTWFIFRLNERKMATGMPAIRMSQIQIPIVPSDASRKKDAELIETLRKEAAGGKLGEAASKHQLITSDTDWFAQSQFVAPLMQLPQMQQWALSSEKGALSRAYSTDTGWVLGQVTDTRPGGVRPYDAVKLEAKMALELSLRQAKPMADAQKILDAVNGGQSLEAAAAAMGVTAAPTDSFPRSNPPASIALAPRAVGLAFALPVGRTGGPVATPSGALLVRKDAEAPGSPAQYEAIKGQLSQTLLNSRQQRYLRDWVQASIARNDVKDMRAPIEEPQQ